MDWFRYYTDTLEKRKIQSLPLVLFRAWVNLLCVARIFDGVIPDNQEVAYRLRCTERQAANWISQLKQRKLLDDMPNGDLVPHDWDEHQRAGDTSAERTRRYRNANKKRHRDVTVTSPKRHSDGPDADTDTDTETDTEQTFPLVSEFPDTAMAVRSNFPAAADPLIVEVAHLAVQAYADVVDGTSGMPPLTDMLIAEAVREAYFKKQDSPYAFKTTVPRVVRSWAEEALRQKRIQSA